MFLKFFPLRLMFLLVLFFFFWKSYQGISRYSAQKLSHFNSRFLFLLVLLSDFPKDLDELKLTLQTKFCCLII
ncbi:hypothetical protein AQUCO_01000662v1 [Aquilegia coerulea]|uniref:Uncharacterized protein n=1 Tax=Aquilegia coerulea TaxID=218851 RepID=A0A2G5EB27_AQUCA|nr:hypothetical protein AQUCO_01000662v1 [Aquilegia coerulea]